MDNKPYEINTEKYNIPKLTLTHKGNQYDI